MMIRYGEVHWVDLPTYSEFVLTKNRPCVIVSNDFNNYGSSTVQVVPITSSEKRADLPCHITTEYGMVKCENIMTVDRNAVGNKMGTLNEVELRQLKTAIMTQLGII